MAKVGNLDFRAYVDAKEAQTNQDNTVERAYAYVSDRNTRATFDKVKPVELAVSSAVRLMRQIGRSELLGTAVKVGPRQFPRVHEIATHCADTLGIAPPALYIRNNPTINAMTYGTNDDAFVLIHSALVDHFSDEELLTVIGHECGHIHNDHVVYLTAMHYLKTMAGAVVRWAVAPAMLALSGWSRRAEITCDRAGLLCSRDVEVSTRALAKLALGSTKLYDEFNLDAYIDQYEEGLEGIGRIKEIMASHPWLPKRVKALRVFAGSQLYRHHIGESGGADMETVDADVHAIIKVLR